MTYNTETAQQPSTEIFSSDTAGLREAAADLAARWRLVDSSNARARPLAAHSYEALSLE